MRRPIPYSLILCAVTLATACTDNPVEPADVAGAAIAPFSTQIEGDVDLSMTARGYDYNYNASVSGTDLEIVLYSASIDQEIRDERALVRIEIPFDTNEVLGEGVEYEFRLSDGDDFQGEFSYRLRNPGTDSVLRSRYAARTLTMRLHRPDLPTGTKDRLVGTFKIVAPRVVQERVVSGNVIPSETTDEQVVVRGAFDIKVYQTR